MAKKINMAPYKDIIVSKYLAGHTAYEIAEDIPPSKQTIYRSLRKWNIQIRSAIPRYISSIKLDEQKDIKQRYLSGESLHGIMLDYSYAWDTGKRLLEHMGISVKGHYEYDHECFSGLNEYSMYFAGLIVADGCIAYQGGHPNIYLASKDIDIINKFLRFVNAPNKTIFKSKQGVYQVSIRSRNMTNDLLSMGIVPRKSFVDFCIVDPLIGNRHFWRGVIDGDGHIGWSNKKYPKIYLASSCKVLIGQFISFLDNNNLYRGNKLLSCRSNTFFMYQQTSGPVLDILKLLYIGSSVHMDRKFNKSMELIDEKRRY